MWSKGKFGAAVEAFSEAICFDPSNAVYFTNRAMCHRKNQKWDLVISDCETALNLEPTNIKAHYQLGVALDETGEHEAAVSHLHRALELCKEKTVSYKEDIQRQLLGARKRHWECVQAGAITTLNNSESVVSEALQLHYGTALSQGNSSAADEAEAVGACAAEAFESARAKHVPGRVPDYLTCRITLEIMLDPVVTPDGITYERSAILQHLKANGDFDPVTRKPLSAGRLVANLALKEAINSFLEQNPWAYECAN